MAWVQSLVRELRSRKLRGMAKKNVFLSGPSTILNTKVNIITFFFSILLIFHCAKCFVWIVFIPKVTQRGRDYYYPYFTDEETEAQEG